MDRAQISFRSGDEECAGWLYRPAGAPDPVACVVMAHGFGATKAGGLAAYAERFADAGYAVLVFDYRHFGDSGGAPRQLLSVRRQQADWRAAVVHARALDGVDPERIALWGSSFSGGHVVVIAAADARVRTVVAQVPHTDGPATLRAAGPGDLARLTAAGLRDLVGAALGRAPYLIPIVGPPGTTSAMNSPDAEPGYGAMFPAGVRWRNEVSARAALQVGTYSPGRRASRVRCPLLVQIATEDAVTPPDPARRVAARAPRAELLAYPGGHFDFYIGDLFERVVSDQVGFLGRASRCRQRAMRLVHVLGTRPNFVKMAPVIAAARERFGAGSSIVVHTGQHYDRAMSEVFFEELGVPEPDHMLGIGSGQPRRADRAGARAARAGAARRAPRPRARPRRRQLDARGRALRGAAGDPDRPRRVRPAQLRPHDARGDQPGGHRPSLGAAVPALARGRGQPARGGCRRGPLPVRRQHDDRHAGRARGRASAPARRRSGWASSRAPTCWSPCTARRSSTGRCSARRWRRSPASPSEMPVVFPVHPRTRKMLAAPTLGAVTLIDPIGYLDFLSLEADAAAVLTDSAGSRRRPPTSASPASPCATTPSAR